MAGRNTHFERLGGEPVLRAIIHDFVHAMVNDAMIGFFFRDVDPERLERMEYQFTARFLGAEDIAYEGRPMRTAHARHPIMGGQFDRRKQILENTLVHHAVPEPIRTAWLEHVEKLRGTVTRDARGQCNDTEPAPAPSGRPLGILASDRD